MVPVKQGVTSPSRQKPTPSTWRCRHPRVESRGAPRWWPTSTVCDTGVPTLDVSPEIAPFVPNRSTIANTHFFRIKCTRYLFVGVQNWPIVSRFPVRKGFVLWIGCTLTITVSGLIDFVLWTYQFGRELFIKNATVSYRSVLLRVVWFSGNWPPNPLRV